MLGKGAGVQCSKDFLRWLWVGVERYGSGPSEKFVPV